MDDPDHLEDLFAAVVHELHAAEFPAGAAIPIPTPGEQALLVELQRSGEFPVAAMQHLRTTVTRDDSYVVVIWAVRTAIFAERTANPRAFGIAGFGLAVDEDLVDWRDILRAMAVFEEIAERMGISLEESIQHARAAALPDRAHTIDAHFRRRPAIRSIDVMALSRIATEQGITYIARV
jgi:hypothetical protein